VRLKSVLEGFSAGGDLIPLLWSVVEKSIVFQILLLRNSLNISDMVTPSFNFNLKS